MLIDYYKGKKSHIDNFNTPLIVFAAFAAGYTISDFHPNFLRLFTSPIGQFIVYFIILFTMYKDDKTFTILDIVIETTIYVIIVQAFKYIVTTYYFKNQ